jgi:hypothetical protein
MRQTHPKPKGKRLQSYISIPNLAFSLDFIEPSTFLESAMVALHLCASCYYFAILVVSLDTITESHHVALVDQSHAYPI